MRTLLLILMAASVPSFAQSAAAADPAPQSVEPARIRLSLTDGSQLNCELLGEAPDKITIRIAGGAPIDVPRSQISQLERLGGRSESDYWFRDPNVTRHFYAPTAFMLRKGEMYFSQKELFYSSFGYGVTDHFSLLVGSAVPLWFMQPTQNLIAGLKLGWDVNDLVHVAAGAQGLYLPGLGTTFQAGMGFAFGTVTVGTPNLNGTISAGEALLMSSQQSETLHTAVIVAGGLYRLSPNVALETENWFFPEVQLNGFLFSGIGEPFLMLNSAGVRLMNEHLAADLGLIRIPGSVIPMPWVDFTYTFGK